ncbi:MAG: hypothetical protein HC781_03385 [Leptolyngbyaceae cyanobacterium CSU_1_4]|nr:hypothetical protein [Leptolyngbyaceae cyanobacterium CSU_1_4]
MSTAKTKKIMRRRQKGPLHRRSARPDVPIGAQRSRSLADSIADRSVNPASSPPPQSSRRLSAPATLTRRLGASDPGRGRSEARRARADARASKPPAASPQVNKPATLKRQNASRDLVQSKAQSNAPSNNAPSNNAPSKSPTHGKRARAAGQPKVDFATGRTLFPVESGGKTEYLPIASEATPHEQKLGLFVETDSVKRDAVNKPLDPATAKPASLQDYGTDRTLFATENTNGNREYLPKESEATALELSQGKYVPDDQVELPSVGNSVLDKPPRFDWNGQRTLFATQAANGKIEYLPKRSEATALELSQGRYVKDDQISAKAPIGAENAMSPLKPRYDLGKGANSTPSKPQQERRSIYPAKARLMG